MIDFSRIHYFHLPKDTRASTIGHLTLTLDPGDTDATVQEAYFISMIYAYMLGTRLRSPEFKGFGGDFLAVV